MKKVIAHSLKDLPKDYYYGNDETDNLSDYDLDGLNVDEVWYWYSYMGYEGAGFMIARKGSKWSSMDLGHCSCYGPTENSFGIWVDSFTELKSKFIVNKGYWKEVEPVFNMINKI